MVLLGVMRLVENQEVDLAHLHKRIEESLVQNLCCAHDDHVLAELISPNLLIPEIRSHGTEDVCHVLIQIVTQDSRLLENKSNTVNLVLVSRGHIKRQYQNTKKNDTRGAFPFARPISSHCSMYLRRSTAIKVFPEPDTTVSR